MLQLHVGIVELLAANTARILPTCRFSKSTTCRSSAEVGCAHCKCLQDPTRLSRILQLFSNARHLHVHVDLVTAALDLDLTTSISVANRCTKLSLLDYAALPMVFLNVFTAESAAVLSILNTVNKPPMIAQIFVRKV